MEAKRIGDMIQIIANGIELLKIKATVAKSVGQVATGSKNTISFPFQCLDIVSSDLPEIIPFFPYELNILKSHRLARLTALASITENRNELISHDWLNILDIPQQYAVNAMITKNLMGLCLFDEQGSGKTVMTIAAFDMLKKSNYIDAMIVICPKSMLQGWGKDIKQFLGTEQSFEIAQGNRADKREQALSNFEILISNYEGIDAMTTVLAALANTKRLLLVVDESYYAKNEQSVRSSNIWKVRSFCARCFVLCGTPAPNSPYDLVNQFNIADNGYTFPAFSRTNKLDSDKGVITTLIAERGTYIRRLKSEIFDSIPEKIFQVIHVALTGRQKEIYEKAKSSLLLELRSYDNTKFKKDLATYFQKRAALLQICAIPTNIDPTYLETPAKYIELDKLLKTLLEENKKVIIWTFYKSSIRELEKRYAIHNPLVIDGDSTTDERKNTVESFQNTSDKLLLIANPAAAGAGITLHSSHNAVYVSFTNQAAHYLQSLDRIHRRGQTSNIVNYYLLVCQKTIEESEVTRLRLKELQQHELLGDLVTWPTSLDDALAELTAGD